jgi:hypothetical protein
MNAGKLHDLSRAPNANIEQSKCVHIVAGRCRDLLLPKRELGLWIAVVAMKSCKLRWWCVLVEHVLHKGAWTKVEASWWLWKQAMPQAGNRAGKIAPCVQWQDCMPEHDVGTSRREKTVRLHSAFSYTWPHSCLLCITNRPDTTAWRQLLPVCRCEVFIAENSKLHAELWPNDFRYRPFWHVIIHRSHFGSRYKSGRCVLRSPF